jgi:hypothetical protein
MKQKLKTFEVITGNGSGHFVSAYTKKQVYDFFITEKPKKIIERKDIDPDTNLNIS